LNITAVISNNRSPVYTAMHMPVFYSPCQFYTSRLQYSVYTMFIYCVVSSYMCILISPSGNLFAYRRIDIIIFQHRACVDWTLW